MDLIHFEDSTYLLQGRKGSKDKLGRLFWPWPTSDTLMKSDPGPASHKAFLWERNPQNFSVHLAWDSFAGAENLLC